MRKCVPLNLLKFLLWLIFMLSNFKVIKIKSHKGILKAFDCIMNLEIKKLLYSLEFFSI
jgi:hypothetical protein